MSRLTLTSILTLAILCSFSPSEAQAFGRGGMPFRGFFRGVFRAVFTPVQFWRGVHARRMGMAGYGYGMPMYGGNFYSGGMDGGCGGGQYGMDGQSCGVAAMAPAPRVQPSTSALIYLKGVPQGAKLFVSGRDFTLKGAAPDVRGFARGDLQPGYQYKADFEVRYLTTKNEVAIGKRSVTYRPGDVININLKDHFKYVVNARKPAPTSAPGTPTKPAPTITPEQESDRPSTFQWHMPQEARIFIDGEEVNRKKVADVITPPLKANTDYYYDFRVEYDQLVDGKTELVVLEKRVKFTAGSHFVLGIGQSEPAQLLVASAPDKESLAAYAKSAPSFADR